MAHPASAVRRAQVGEFHLDLDSGELVGNGTRVRLQVQSLELLKALLEQPGLMVGRDELRQRLWPNDTFVDFDHGLNAAVRRLREALGDSADAPRFVETIPRKGYRLIAATDVMPPSGPVAGVMTAPQRETPPPWRLKARLSLWALVACAAAVSLIVVWLGRGPARSVIRPPFAMLTIDVPNEWVMQNYDVPAVSPDGRHVAFTATPPREPREGGSLWLRSLAEPAVRQISGIAHAVSPFWAPDSSAIGFFSSGTLMTVPRAGGTVQVLAPAPLMGGAAWMPNGDILFTPVVGRAVHRLEGGSGTPQPVTTLEGTHREHAHLWPHAVPGSDRFTFLSRRNAAVELIGFLGEVGARTPIELGPTDSRVVPTSSGHLLWVHEGTLFAQRLDSRRSALVGKPTAIAQDVAVLAPTLGHFSASADVVVYLTNAAVTRSEKMTLFDRSGAMVGTIGELGQYTGPRVSPDGLRVAVARRDARTGRRDVWLHDLSGKPALRLTFDPHDDTAPVWSADGLAVLFSSDRRGDRDVYRKDVTGQQPERLVHSSDESETVNAWSRDGRFLIYDTGARGSVDAQGRVNRSDVHALSLDGASTPWAIAATPAQEAMADISPDGSLVAYQSSEIDGRPEVVVETFPKKGGRWQVTTTGGSDPVWRADGRELFFLSPRGEMSSLDVSVDAGSVRFGPSRVLYQIPNL